MGATELQLLGLVQLERAWDNGRVDGVMCGKRRKRLAEL